MIDYDGFRKLQAEAFNEGRLLGLGLSLYVEPSGIAMGSLATEAATIQVSVNGQNVVRILASGVPSVGYKVYEVAFGTGTSYPAAAAVHLPWFDNGTYRVTYAQTQPLRLQLTVTATPVSGGQPVTRNFTFDLPPAGGVIFTQQDQTVRFQITGLTPGQSQSGREPASIASPRTLANNRD